MKSNLIILISLILGINSIYSQKGVDTGTKFGQGEDSIRCGKNLSLYDQDYRQKRYIEAFESWEQAFNECPLSTINLYSHGVKIVAAKYEAETNVEKKESYYQLLMKVYDQRSKYFGTNSKYPTAYIMGIKALDMLQYKGKDQMVSKQAYDYLKTNIITAPSTAQPAIIAAYFNTTIELYQTKQLIDTDVINNYNTATSWLDNEITNEKREDKIADLKTLKSKIDLLFSTSGAASCETLETIYTPIIDSKLSDKEWLKSAVKILNSQSCEESGVKFKAAEALYKLEPSSDAAYSIARTYLKRKNISGTIEYYNYAINLENDAVVKAKYYYQLGLVLYSQGDLVSSKAKALQAISLNSSYGDPYILLGKLYASGSKNYGKNDFEQKTVFWVAVDKFYKAKQVDPTVTEEANDLISAYSIHFPAQEELFFQGLKNGDSYMVGEWIGESTIIRNNK